MRTLKHSSPFLNAFIAVGAVMLLLLFISWIFGWKNQELEKMQKDFFAKNDARTIVEVVVILAPIEEEAIFRGPAWILLMILLGVSAFLKKRGRPLPWPDAPISKSKRFWGILGKITVSHILVWPVIIAPTIVWALGHPYPLPIFATGLVFGWLLIKTKSLVRVALLHMVLNAAAVAGLFVRALIF